MPTFLLCVKPELEGLVSFEPGEGCDWKLDFKQSAGSEERKGVVVDPQNEEEVPNAKGDTKRSTRAVARRSAVSSSVAMAYRVLSNKRRRGSWGDLRVSNKSPWYSTRAGSKHGSSR